MNLKSLATAAGVAALTLTPSSAFALSAGVLQQSGANLRVMVSHGGAPTEVRMIAVDEDYNALEDTRAFPAVLMATSEPRRVTMSVPTNTWAICAQTTNAYVPEGELGIGFIVESCARVNPHKLQRDASLNFGARRTRGGVGLQRSLQNPDVQIIQEGEEGRTSS